MAIRKDKVQISIAFLTDEDKKYAKLVQENKSFISDLNKTKKAGGDLSGIIDKIVNSGKKASNVKLENLASSQLVTRARQLSAAMKLIPQSTPQFKALESELKDINDTLATARSRTKGVATSMDKARQSGSRFGGVMKNAFSFFLGQGLFSAVTGVFRAMKNFTVDAVAGIDEGIKRDAQIKQQLINTNSAAGKSFDELAAQAKALTKETLFSDESIKNAQAITLTFTNIRDEVFDRTIPVIQDLSTVLGTDLKSTSIQVGKALNDPIAGISALSRSGVQFNDSQKAMIKTLVETNDVAGAQKIILDELEKQVGGTAKAAAEAGLGPYQLLKQRLIDVQESVGVLIERGLKFLLPLLTRGTVFLESLTDSLVSGEAATGKYADGVNRTIGFVTKMVNVFQFLSRVGVALFNNVISPLANFFVGPLKSAFSAMSGEGSILSDVLANGGAAFEGLSAAANQAVENVKAKFSILVNSAKIFGKQLRSAITFDDETQAQLAQEISDLKKNNTLAAESGKSVGEAYRDARDKAIADSAATQATAAEAAPSQRASIQPEADTDQDFSIGGASESSIKKKQDNQRKLIQQFAIEEETILEGQRLRGQINQEQFQARMIEIKRNSLQEQIKLLTPFGESQKLEIAKLNNQIVELEQNGAIAIQQAQLQGVDDTNAILIAKAKEQFLSRQLTQQEFDQQERKLNIKAARAKLIILENAGQQESLLYRQLQNEILTIKREGCVADAKSRILGSGFEAAETFFQLGVDLLKKDSEARKKAAKALKAFQIGQVVVSGIKEVQSIWENAATLGPIAGPITGGIQTAIAVGRSAIAINKIKSAKLARGGAMQFGVFGGKPHSQGGTKGYFDDGTQIEVEKDELFAVVNKRDTATLGNLSRLNSTHGVPFFRDGGTLDTTPSIPTAPSSSGQQQSDRNFEIMVQLLTGLNQRFDRFPTRLRADVVYSDITEAGDTLNSIETEANL